MLLFLEWVLLCFVVGIVMLVWVVVFIVDEFVDVDGLFNEWDEILCVVLLDMVCVMCEVLIVCVVVLLVIWW